MIQLTEQRIKTRTAKKIAAKTDTDRRDCISNQGIVITKVAGYTFSYPCTAATDDRVNHRNKKFGNFDLKLQLGLRDVSDRIWPISKNHQNIKDPASVKLFNAGFSIERPEFNTLLKGYQILEKFKAEGMAFYQNHRRVAVRLVYQRDAAGHQPTLKCTLGVNENPVTLFNNLEVNVEKSNCRAYWMLTEDVAVLMFNFHPKNIMHFKDIHRKVDAGLKKIIIESPPVLLSSDVQ